MRLTPRAKLALIASCFVVPMVLSYLAYRFLHAQPTGNYGELLLPPAQAPAQVFDETKGRWALVMSDSGRCADACLQKLTLLRQVQLALGRRASRVARVYIVDDQAAPDGAMLREYEGTVVASTPRGAALPKGLGSDRAHVYLVDPHGNVMMRWPASADQKRMLRDLERLLKASQIGHNDGLRKVVPC